jgi:cytochrome c biogenesis protein CcmG, thiol:disulfide interchange protein DsbE
MKRNAYIAIGILVSFSLLVILAYGLFFASDPTTLPSALIGRQAEPFSVTTFDGQTLSLEAFKDRPIVLNFWASWCVSCRQEAHLLEAAHRRYTPQGAVFIGIAINDTPEAAHEFIRRHGKTYWLALDDDAGSISLDYGVTAVPETFFIDKSGVIRDKILGPVQPGMLDAFLDEQLN